MGSPHPQTGLPSGSRQDSSMSTSGCGYCSPAPVFPSRGSVVCFTSPPLSRSRHSKNIVTAMSTSERNPSLRRSRSSSDKWPPGAVTRRITLAGLCLPRTEEMHRLEPSVHRPVHFGLCFICSTLSMLTRMYIPCHILCQQKLTSHSLACTPWKRMKSVDSRRLLAEHVWPRFQRVQTPHPPPPSRRSAFQGVQQRRVSLPCIHLQRTLLN
jgi:hypothetical protein